ncbi:MAG: methyltransferase type 11 [Deltaproteobacteria bacterium HGW-Deltaproteobacteria-15]|jgi:SAM-dependent methyltransferase|nr:MAG: methyltransferase type 11 [Deltaproteobacteria bacterium HGW-Deltaproteobacteria-15]
MGLDLMDPSEYELMYKAEESHWWYVGMAAITKTILATYCIKGGGLRILDAGCGTGGAMSWLTEYGDPVGLDLSAHALDFCKRRGHDRICKASVMNIPFAEDTFDLVLSLDVLYFANIADNAALQEFRRILVPNGMAVLRVPAYDWLRGAHDRKLSTGHRYTLSELKSKMERNGLKPEFLTYANTFLFPIAMIKRLCERWLPGQAASDTALEMKSLGGVMKGFLIQESRIIRRRSLPFGLSIMAVGRKEV